MYGYQEIGSAVSLRSRSQPKWLVKRERFLAHCNNDFCQRKPNNNPVAHLSPANLCSKFPSIQGVGSMGGGTSEYPRIVDRIKRRITTMLLIMSTLSFLYTMLWFIYYTFIHISFGHSCNCFIHITCRLFKSWLGGPTLLHLLRFFPAPGVMDYLSTTRISEMILARYSTIATIIEMTILNSMMSLFGDHPAEQLASGHQEIPSCQHFEYESRQLK